MAKRDYYEVLGAKKGASAEELKKAAEDYRARFLRLLEDQAHILKADDSLFAK